MNNPFLTYLIQIPSYSKRLLITLYLLLMRGGASSWQRLSSNLTFRQILMTLKMSLLSLKTLSNKIYQQITSFKTLLTIYA